MINKVSVQESTVELGEDVPPREKINVLTEVSHPNMFSIQLVQKRRILSREKYVLTECTQEVTK